MAQTVAEAVLDDTLDPVAIGVSGSWGSGKTTVLRLVRAALAEHNLGPDEQVLIVDTDPWRYDPGVGAKETLISEVLGALEQEIREEAGAKGQAREMVKKLRRRVDWSKALQIAGKTSLALQLPTVDDLTKLVNTDANGAEGGEARGLEAFRTEFENLMGSKQLAHIRRVVVLVDDLDRCLYETVVGTLETIRLFLAVPKMSFVIAADEHKVAEALRPRFSVIEGAGNGRGESPEEAASLYLHKIVQTTVPLPALSRFDTEAYLVLLQLSHELEKHELQPYIDSCADLRSGSGLLDDLADMPGRDITAEMAFASRLTPILYEKLRGNPRRIKRFLNDLRVRQSVAQHRGISLAPEIVAKLMVLEVLLDDGFKKVLDWLAKGELRDQIQALETAAGRPTPAEATSDTDAEPPAEADTKRPPAEADGPGFTDDLVRWAKLTPALGGLDLAPYLYLAASFTGQVLLDVGLPERLRDITANLLSSSRAEQKSVTEADLAALTTADALAIVQHLGRVARDRTAQQTVGVVGILRITRVHGSLVEAAAKSLGSIPAAELQAQTVLRFERADMTRFRDVMEGWQAKLPDNSTKRALHGLLSGGIA
ncbi:P-loop NTPase fold protein [Nonomuraea sp. NPDC048881]|uniref:KAP family P-loop NTPase fold protein n=1 Tax=Nonomuraea sp. NPDC048881 TaxID=3155030 RepID=UPI0033C161F0